MFMLHYFSLQIVNIQETALTVLMHAHEVPSDQDVHCPTWSTPSTGPCPQAQGEEDGGLGNAEPLLCSTTLRLHQ